MVYLGNTHTLGRIYSKLVSMYNIILPRAIQKAVTFAMSRIQQICNRIQNQQEISIIQYQLRYGGTEYCHVAVVRLYWQFMVPGIIPFTKSRGYINTSYVSSNYKCTLPFYTFLKADSPIRIVLVIILLPMRSVHVTRALSSGYPSIVKVRVVGLDTVESSVVVTRILSGA